MLKQLFSMGLQWVLGGGCVANEAAMLAGVCDGGRWPPCTQHTRNRKRTHLSIRLTRIAVLLRPVASSFPAVRLLPPGAASAAPPVASPARPGPGAAAEEEDDADKGAAAAPEGVDYGAELLADAESGAAGGEEGALAMADTQGTAALPAGAGVRGKRKEGVREARKRGGVGLAGTARGLGAEGRRRQVRGWAEYWRQTHQI